MSQEGEARLLNWYNTVLDRTETIQTVGHIEEVRGLSIVSRGPALFVGEQCSIVGLDGQSMVPAEVIGVKGTRSQIMPYENCPNIAVGQEVRATGEPLQIAVSPMLLGRVLNSRGHLIDARGPIIAEKYYPVEANIPHVLERRYIEEQIQTGIRAIDAFVPTGKGQRLGIFSGSGVGKSTLLGMIARNTSATVNVIALIGERGREVSEFIRNILGPEGLQRSVIVVSTSDLPPLSRIQGAFAATAVAEYFRDQGKDVMLLFDSLTRFARAQRELGLALGEPPATRGFPPSVFSLLPKLLERCGSNGHGAITGFYNILVEGDDMDEPVSDAVRGILDGHVVLSRRLARRSHYPAIDPLNSISRLESAVTDKEMQNVVGTARRQLGIYADSEDLINVGAYVEGSNSEIDTAIASVPAINDFLRQGIDERSSLQETRRALQALQGEN